MGWDERDTRRSARRYPGNPRHEPGAAYRDHHGQGKRRRSSRVYARTRSIDSVRSKNLYTLTDTNESLDQMELADRVHAFNIRYYDEQNRVWLDEWPSATKLPKAVLLEVTFQYPDAAPWTVREWVTIGTS